jgi:curved DNA-binding protein CbpA
MSNPFTQCPFRVLGLPDTATKDDVLKQWKQLIRHMHPDKNPDSNAIERTQIINNAKDRAIEECLARDQNGSGQYDAAWLRKFEKECEEMRNRTEEELRQQTRQREEEDARWRQENEERIHKKKEADTKQKEEQDKRYREEALFDHTTTNAEQLESELRKDCAERKGREDAEQRLADVEKKLGSESKAKDEAMRQLAEMKVKLESEKTSKDDAKQQLAEMTTKMEDERRSKDEAKQQSAELSTAINAERKFKTDAQQKLAEMTTQLNDERKSKDEIKQQLEDMTVKMEDERKSKDEVKQQLANALGREMELTDRISKESADIESEDEPTTNTKKRNMSHLDSTSTQKQKMHKSFDGMICKINNFLAQHLTVNERGFIASSTLQMEFEKEQLIVFSLGERDVFRKSLKRYISETFHDTEWSCSRKICQETKGKQQGYRGLCFQ